MTVQPQHDLSDLSLSESWANSVTDDLERSNRRAWTVAIVASVIALLLAIALVILLPLKTVEPYTILVDRQTGNVERLASLDEQVITADTALTRSFLVQYVTARESFSQDALQDDYRKVSLWSAKPARDLYQRQMQATNPASPLSYLPSRATLKTEVKSVSPLADNRAMVRFTTSRTDPGATSQAAQHWVAVLTFGFSASEMSEQDRYVNPLGFQVLSYRKDAETLPEEGIVNGVELPEAGGQQ